MNANVQFKEETRKLLKKHQGIVIIMILLFLFYIIHTFIACKFEYTITQRFFFYEFKGFISRVHIKVAMLLLLFEYDD